MTDALTLKVAGMRFLAYDRKCLGVVCERHVRYGLGNPDILGVTKARYTLEIEIKVTMSDFRKNAEKRHVARRGDRLTRWPKQFWFLVPPKLLDKAKAELPDYAGLLTLGQYNVIVESVKAPNNNMSEKLSVLECAKLIRCQTNHIIAAESSVLMYKNINKDIEEDFAI